MPIRTYPTGKCGKDALLQGTSQRRGGLPKTHLDAPLSVRHAPPKITLDLKNGQTLTVVRSGRGVKGLGDMVSLLGALSTHKAQRPNSPIHLLADEPYRCLAENHPAVDAMLGEVGDISPDSLVADLGLSAPCGRIERFYGVPDPPPRNTLFAQALGLSHCEAPRLRLTERELAWGKRWHEERSLADPVGFVLRTSKVNKDYRDMRRLFAMAQWKYDAYLVEPFEIPEGSYPTTTGLTVRQQMAVIAHSRCLVSGDTGWLHVGGALQVPLIGMFGSFHGPMTIRPYEVPFTVVSGPCPLGLQPCRGAVCEKEPPCLGLPADVAFPQVDHFLQSLP